MVSTSPALREDVEASGPLSGQKQHIASAPSSVKKQRSVAAPNSVKEQRSAAAPSSVKEQRSVVAPASVKEQRIAAVPTSSKKQRDDSKTSTTPSQRKLRLDLERMNPTKRTNEWLKKTETPAKGAHQANLLGVRNSRVTKPAARALISKNGSNSKPPGKPRSKSRNNWWLSRVWTHLFSKKKDDKSKNGKPTDENPEDELEGDTLIGDGTPTKRPNPDDTAIEGETPNQSADPEGDTTLIGDDHPTLPGVKIKVGKDGRIYDAKQFRGWTEEEIWLWDKLDWRGYEPLLPKSWDGDFRTMYDALFSEDDSVPFIKSVSGNDYHAIKALRGLIYLSGHSRDRAQLGLDPEEILRREIESYWKWSMQDAGLAKTDHIPAITIATAVPHESVASVVGRVTDQLHEMGNQFRSLWLDYSRCSEMDKEKDKHYVHKLPTLYGIVIKYTVVAFLTYDASKPGQAVRCVGTYTFGKEGQDVWNALAVSILFIRARNYLMELAEEGELGDVVDDEDDDEDA